MEIIMSQLTENEIEIAAQLKSAELGDLSGETMDLQKMGFKDGSVSSEGVNAHNLMTDISNVAYKVMKNKASDLSKAKAKMADISQRYGRDNKAYDKAQSEFNEALDESKDAELRHQLTSHFKGEVGQAVVKGMTF